MGARTTEPAGRNPGRIQDEIDSFAQARQVAEAHQRPDIAGLLDQATELARIELNAQNA